MNGLNDENGKPPEVYIVPIADVIGEWVITYTPIGGGIGHSRALSWFAPHLLNDYERIADVMRAAESVIKSQLDSREDDQFIGRQEKTEFGIAWIEEHELKIT